MPGRPGGPRVRRPTGLLMRLCLQPWRRCKCQLACRYSCVPCQHLFTRRCRWRGPVGFLLRALVVPSMADRVALGLLRLQQRARQLPQRAW